MNRVEGRTAFITGIGQGQGRAHAFRLAQEGADIIGVDLLSNIPSVPYDLSSEEHLQETVRLVESTGRKIVALQGDVRSQDDLDQAVNAGLSAFGKIDIVSANAGIWAGGPPAWELSDNEWQDVIDVDLTGVWRTVKATVPAMIDHGQGGSVILTSSGAGMRAMPNLASYVAAKFGVTGLVKALANELAPHRIRVNGLQPGNIDTQMLFNDTMMKHLRPDLDSPEREDIREIAQALHLLPEPWLQPSAISEAVLWLASDEAQFVTGVSLPVDAGLGVKAV
jgi:(+)-trans-carveol dehydrogenase